jgi:hypothetical protein
MNSHSVNRSGYTELPVLSKVVCRQKDQVPVDNFVAVGALNSTKIQQDSTSDSKRCNHNHLEIIEFRKFQ